MSQCVAMSQSVRSTTMAHHHHELKNKDTSLHYHKTYSDLQEALAGALACWQVQEAAKHHNFRLSDPTKALARGITPPASAWRFSYTVPGLWNRGEPLREPWKEPAQTISRSSCSRITVEPG